MTKPRIPAISGKDGVAPEFHPLVDDVIGVFGQVRGPFSMLLHSPGLAELVLPLVPFLREKSIVPTGLRMAGILAAVRERDSHYVWSAQAGFARRNGIREELIDLLRAKGDSAALPEDERDVVEYARQLMRHNRVDQALFDKLNGQYGAQWMVEMTAGISFYVFLTGVANAFDVPPQVGGDLLPGDVV